MENRKKIEQIIFTIIDNVNKGLDAKNHVSKRMDAELLAKIDSLGMAILLMETEKSFEDDFGLTLSLTDNEQIFREDGPLQSVGSFVQFMEKLVVKRPLSQDIISPSL